MMLFEALMVPVIAILLGIVGVGPALWMLSKCAQPWDIAIYVAPALGLALFTLIGFPLVRFVGPIQSWALPATIALVIISLILTAIFWRRRGFVKSSIPWKLLIFESALFLVCTIVLAAPLAVNGIQYAIFRSNSSDAFVYVSLAETIRTAGWGTILNGSVFSPQNMEGVTRLASISPTSLFTARLIALSFVLNNSANLGWFAALAGVPVYRFFYAYHLICLVCTFPLAIALAKRLELKPILVYLSAGAIVLGFWSKYVLETDASGEIAALPLMMLSVVAWVLLEQDQESVSLPGLVLIALGIASVLTVNSPELAVLVGAMVIYYAIELFRRARSIRQIVPFALAFVLALVILLVTLQIDYILGNSLRAAGAVGEQAAFRGPAVEMLGADPVPTLWGMPRDILFGALRTSFRLPLQWASIAFGIILTGAVLFTFYFVLRRGTNAGHRILVSLVLAGFVLFGYLYLADNEHAASKAITFVFPYLILTPLLLSNYTGRWANPRWNQVLIAVFSLWLGLQVLMSVYVPYNPGVRGIFLEGRAFKRESYDLSPILAQLEQLKPSTLLVDVPRGKNWTFAYYTMLALAPYHPYFLSGLIVDNNVKYRNLWLHDIPGAPDYIVVPRASDYIAAHNWGVRVSSTPDLILYQLTTRDTSVYQARAKANQAQDANKPLFPSLQP